MEDLIELTSLINRQKVKHLDFLEERGNPSNKILALYQGLIDNKFKNDIAPIDSIYNNRANKEINFTKLKSRLRKRLVSALFSIDLNEPSYNEFQKAYYSCYRDWSAVRLLVGKGARRTAVSLAHQVILKAVKFEFTYIALEASRFLRNHYCLYGKDRLKYEKYHTLFNHYKKVYQVESLAEEYYHNLKAYFNFSKNLTQENARLAADYANEIKTASKGLDSYLLNLYKNHLYVYQYQLTDNYKMMMEKCSEAVSFFKNSKYHGAKTAISIFQNKYLACCIQLKRFTEGESILKEDIANSAEGSGNWFAAHRLYIYLCFHTKRFEEAYTLFSKLYSHKTFNRQINNEKDVWKTFEVYINYFNSFFQFDANEQKTRKKFRLNKYLNEIPVYSKNKRAKNIPILIIHILYLLQQKKYDKVIDRLDALNQYSYRYLRDDESFRSNCFIKMLIQLPRAHFHKQGVIRKADKYFEKLKSRPIQISEQSDEIEIVPYEILWEFVLKSLDNKFH